MSGQPRPGAFAVMALGEALSLPPGWGSDLAPPYRRLRILAASREPVAAFAEAVQAGGGHQEIITVSAALVDLLASAPEPVLYDAAARIQPRHPDLTASIEHALRSFQNPPSEWAIRGRSLPLARRTLVMGILNVTPDSFSDGGRFRGPDEAAAAGGLMVDEGADILDIGGESTRPGAARVSQDEELRRVCPAIEALRSRLEVPISVDTSRAEVARQALACGADIINDVTAGADPEMSEVASAAGAGLVLMHMQGSPRTMQESPRYDDLLREVFLFLHDRLHVATQAGIPPERVAVDPGLGFGKTLHHNLALIARLREFTSLGAPILSGPSRKGFLGALLNLPAHDRVEGTAAACVASILAGASIVRVHDVAPVVRAVRIADAIAQETAAHQAA